jgi:hypothetical protein
VELEDGLPGIPPLYDSVLPAEVRIVAPQGSVEEERIRNINCTRRQGRAVNHQIVEIGEVVVQIQKEKTVDPKQMTVRALRQVLSEYDRSTPPVLPPIPFDIPQGRIASRV